MAGDVDGVGDSDQTKPTATQGTEVALSDKPVPSQPSYLLDRAVMAIQ